MIVSIIGSRGYPYVYSGYETFVAELATRLRERKHEISIYCHRSLFPSRPRELNGIRLVYLPALEFKVLSQFTHSFLSTLHVLTRRVDVIFYVNSANGPFGLLTKIAGKKTAINVDGLEWLRPKWKGLGGKYFRLASYLATKLFDVVVTDCERMAEIYRTELRAEPVTIAYGANVGTSTKPELLRQLNLAPNDYYLVVGRLIPDNNPDLIVREYVQTASARKLVVLGDVPYKDRFARSLRATKDPRIQFPGYVRDPDLLRELYCNCYAYIHGHEFGGTNPSLLTALGYGCCVLALDTPFAREVLADDAHGIYFSKDGGSFARSVRLVEENQTMVNTMRESARSRILDKYTWEGITAQYESLFTRMIQEHR